LEFLDGGSFGCTQDGQLSEVSNTGRASTSLVPIFQDTRGCSSAAMLRSTPYLELAKTNYDHFGNYAITAYLTAHKEALLVASQAESENGYKVALAMEGFADHYLTDLYAGGHLRVPRKEIVDYCRRVVSVVPDGLYQLLTKKMHDYDGKNGILIVLNSGQKTFAYGDDYFAVMGNQLNSIALRTALQASLDQVYAAYYLAQANRTSLNSSVVNFKREKLINDLMQQANLYLPNIKATFEENQSLRQPLFLIKDNGTGQIILPGNATNRGYTVYMLDGANYVPLSCNTVATGGVVNN
jgi:hypothetical protein